jgi:hypothetical protein
VTAGLILVALVAVAVAAFVIAPLVRAGAAEPEVLTGSLGEERELESRNQMLLANLRDLEDDRATTKIGDADYERIKAELSAEAVTVMRRLDALAAERTAAEEAKREAHRPLRYPGPRTPR